MPIYIKSRQVQGVNYVFHNGESYKRTGVTRPLSATTPLDTTDYTKLYVESCSAAALGEVLIPPGQTTDIDMATQGEVQLKFGGSNPGDTGELLFRNGTDTCSIELSVAPNSNLIWDAGDGVNAGTGTPSGYEIDITTLPHTFAYQDCNMNRYDVTLAGLGSYIIKAKRTKLALGGTSVSYYAAASATGVTAGTFTSPDDATADNTNSELINLQTTDPQNVAEYVVYHAANSDVCFNFRYHNDDGEEVIVTDELGIPVLSGNQACFSTDADAHVTEMNLYLSGASDDPITISHSGSALQCGDKVTATDDNGNQVVLEYRKTDISDRLSVDFTTHESTFFIYRNDPSIRPHNIDCVPWTPPVQGDDPINPGDPIEYTPIPIQPVVYNAFFTVTTGSPSQYDVMEGKDLGIHATQYLTAGDLLEITMGGSTYDAHPLTIGTLESGSFVELTETAKHGLNDFAQITYNKEELNNGGGIAPNDWVITFGSMDEGTYYYRCNIHPAMSGEIVVAPWGERFESGSQG